MSASQWIQTTCPFAEPKPACIRHESECCGSWRDLSLPLPLPEAQVAVLRRIAGRISDQCPIASPTMIAVFTGRDAVGKLMAAEALAYEMERTLHRVHASEIGGLSTQEAKRHFTRILHAATAENAILMLDNAEGLPSSLLHMLADYPSPSILATDSGQELSQPLRKAAHYVVDFPFPLDNE